MKRSAVLIAALLLFSVIATTASAQVNARGRLTLLRVHDLGTNFGPPNDVLEAEVVIALDTEPSRFFGFQLRNDANLPVRQAMFDLLRDAFARNLPVSIDFRQVPGKNNNLLFRVWLTPPPSSPGPVVTQ
jgi:hypothetical protein